MAMTQQDILNKGIKFISKNTNLEKLYMFSNEINKNNSLKKNVKQALTKHVRAKIDYLKEKQICTEPENPGNLDVIVQEYEGKKYYHLDIKCDGVQYCVTGDKDLQTVLNNIKNGTKKKA